MENSVASTACKHYGAWQHFQGLLCMQGQRRSWLGILSPLPHGCRCYLGMLHCNQLPSRPVGFVEDMPFA